MRNKVIPDWLWLAGIITLIGAFAVMAIVLGLALGGIGNPQPIGEQVIFDELAEEVHWTVWPDAAWGEVQGSVYALTAPQREMRVFSVASYAPQPPCTIEIAARQVSGPHEAGYGLWLGEELQSTYLAIAVNSNGYFTVFNTGEQIGQPVTDWRLFPHVLPQGENNRIRIDLTGERATVRVNDEVAATFEWIVNEPFYIGFYVETFSTGGATIAFDWLKVWQE